MEQPDNCSSAPEKMGQSGEEEAGLEESMSGSPREGHDRLSGPNVVLDTGNRQPNGISKYDYEVNRIQLIYGVCTFLFSQSQSKNS